MIPLPEAQQLTQGPDAIRLRKKKDRFLFMTYNVKKIKQAFSFKSKGSPHFTVI